MKLSTIYTRARKQVANTNATFICVAIGWLSRIAAEDQCRATEIIMDRLSGEITYGHWIEKHHDEWMDRYMDDPVSGRVAWLDSLIAEFKAKGD